MPGEATTQQGQSTPRARHKPSKSAAGAVSESEGYAQQMPTSQKKGGRRNQQARNAPQPAPAWQDSAPSAAEGYFDATGTFVSPQLQASQNANGQFYMSDGQHIGGAQHQKRKARGGKNQRANGRNAQQENGTATPPQHQQFHQHRQQPHNAQHYGHTDNDQAFSAAMLQTMTPAKAAAYAGPTFHASPAANALPIPKFFSKSVPKDAAPVGLQARLEQEPTKSDSSDKTDSPPVVEAVPTMPPLPVPNRASDSPLDFLFKKDMEEKAKRQSASASLTPPAKQSVCVSPEQGRANPWQSIYGTGPRNHFRQPSNGSGKELFMMELDGREASPRPRRVSPPPPLPRMPNRSVSDHSKLPALSPNSSFQQPPQPSPFYNPHAQQGYPVLSPRNQNPPPMMDHTFSPFNRAPPQQLQTPLSNPHPNGVHIPQQDGYHYGNRNLSPLFKAAKGQDVARPSSGLRQELPSSGVSVAELPDSSSPSRPANLHRRDSREAEKAALAYLQTHTATAPTMPTIPLPLTNSATRSELPGQTISPPPTGITPPGARAYNAKSIEEDLKRMLKLTGGNN